MAYLHAAYLVMNNLDIARNLLTQIFCALMVVASVYYARSHI